MSVHSPIRGMSMRMPHSSLSKRRESLRKWVVVLKCKHDLWYSSVSSWSSRLMGGQPGMQQNLKRMFAATPAIKPTSGQRSSPDAAAPRKRARRDDGADKPAQPRGMPGSPLGAAAAPLLPRSPAQLETDALLQATYGDSVNLNSPNRPASITEKFE